MKKPIVVAFSGGCFSGKTSTIKALKDILSSKGYNVVILDELIRNAIPNNLSIDAIRKYPFKYFALEKKIIREKILQEDYIKYNNTVDNNTIILVDRALTDSLFYYENFVKKDELKLELQKEFYDFHDYLIKKTHEHFENIYDLIIQFKPLSSEKAKANKDKFRPLSIHMSNKYEYECIKRLNNYFVNSVSNCKMIEIDLSSSSGNNCIEKIIENII